MNFVSLHHLEFILLECDYIDDERLRKLNPNKKQSSSRPTSHHR